MTPQDMSPQDAGIMGGGVLLLAVFLYVGAHWVWGFVAAAWKDRKSFCRPDNYPGLPGPPLRVAQMPPVRNPREVEHKPTMGQELSRHYVQCAIAALERPAKYTGDTEDALRSAEFFIRMARQHLLPESDK